MDSFLLFKRGLDKEDSPRLQVAVLLSFGQVWVGLVYFRLWSTLALNPLTACTRRMLLYTSLTLPEEVCIQSLLSRMVGGAAVPTSSRWPLPHIPLPKLRRILKAELSVSSMAFMFPVMTRMQRDLLNGFVGGLDEPWSGSGC